jgi:hypothetical protein
MIASGTRLGPYEVIAPLGSGGMGEVYRARDSRLNRDVAIKIVPASVAGNPDALARFERESRAVAALSHPNILTIYDVGQSGGHPYSVMELLEGETLGARIAHAPLPVRKAVDIAAQIARGLAAAHDKQIVHRDLKPENVFLTPTGGVKILDFGLARSAAEPNELTRFESPTMAPQTTPGTVLGTVGYMSPEQVRGEPTDHRTDIFSLGCVLYEMLTGQRAYRRDTAAETMSAILRDDPPDPGTLNVNVPSAVLRTLRRCLEKRPQERFESARDLAFALESAVDSSSTSAGVALPPVRNRRWLASAAVALVLGTVLGIAAARVMRIGAVASDSTAAQFRRLTFDKGTIRDGRFTPDGQSIVYGAAWNGQPVKIFMARTESPESAPLSLPNARLLSMSRTGELAISLGYTYEGWMGEGTLARSSMLGSAPRVMVEHVREADWNPDGSDLAVVRRMGGLERLEFPLGNVLYQTSGFISHIRFSPSGDRIAFADHAVYADDAGAVSVVDLAGHRAVLSEGWISVHGVAWTSDGSEIWFGGTKGSAVSGDGIYAVTPAGRIRTVMAGPGRYKVLDIAADGRTLISDDREERTVEALMAGSPAPVDVGLRSSSSGWWIADDGTSVLIADQSTESYQTYLLKAGTTTPVHLGPGNGLAGSPDGRWALGLPVEGYPILVHPTGPGESKTLPDPDRIVYNLVGWQDATHVIGFGQKSGERSRGYVQDLNGGLPRPFTPEGMTANGLRWWLLPVAPDGTRVIGADEHGTPMIYSIDGAAPVPVPKLAAGDLPVQWTPDGGGLLVARGDGLPWVVERLDLSTGRRTPATTIRAHDPAGLRLSIFSVSRDAKYYIHTYSRLLSNLFVVNGLK